MLRRVFKDPLTHFLVAGLMMFAAYGILVPAGERSETDKQITVDKPALLEFIQFRTKIFDASHARAILDGMSPEELRTTINDYVREEALYRESNALGLGKSDYVIRRRMVQTLEFVIGNATAPSTKVGTTSLERYYAAHRQDYAIQPTVTMTHVFFDADRRGWDEARRLAKEALAKLNAGHVPFDGAPSYGDRFIYNLNYVDQPPEVLSGHFGAAFAATVFKLQADPARWQGPIESGYGVHLVLLTHNQVGGFPTLADIHHQVETDYLADLANSRREALIKDMIARYQVDIRLPRSEVAQTATR